MKIHIPAGPILGPTARTAAWLKGPGPRYILLGDYHVWVDDELFIVREGFITNLASIPRWLWWIWPPGYGPAAWAAVWHDDAYKKAEVPKWFADEVFYQIMLYKGANPIVAKGFRWAVSTFGRGNW